MRSSDKKVKAIEYLAYGWTVSQVAKLLQVTERTVYRWKLEPGYTQQVRELQQDTLTRLKGRLLGLVDRVVNTYDELLDDPGSKGAYVRRLTCDSIIDNLVKVCQVVDFEERLSELERQVNNVQK